MFEASGSERTAAAPDAVWAVLADPSRWPEWNERFELVEAEGDLAPGSTVQVKQRRGGRMRFEITALESERRLAYEARFPGARYGHEHSVAPEPGSGSEIVHRVYVDGPLAGLWSLMLSRRRIRETAASFGIEPLISGRRPK
jgi:uncharacterized protein YndB with AHSA1/START domain